jgi:hypothetical protein
VAVGHHRLMHTTAHRTFRHRNRDLDTTVIEQDVEMVVMDIVGGVEVEDTMTGEAEITTLNRAILAGSGRGTETAIRGGVDSVLPVRILQECGVY